jgi:8-oxo-dGTP pyrophosphatase MutT (NUDIX family)
MGLQNHALWQVSVKALLIRQDGKLLALITPDGCLDFPGGRVDESERELSWQDSLQREVREELGDDVEIAVGDIAFVSKRVYHKDGQPHHVAAMYFVAQLTGGDVKLSEEHASHDWIEPGSLLTDEYKFMSDDEAQQLQNFVKSRNMQ